MNHTNINAAGQPEARCTVGLRTAAIGLAALVMLGTSAHADMYQPGTTTPGGVPAQSTITSINTVGTNSTVSWYGMEGWYTVLMSIDSGVTYNPVGNSVAASGYAWSNTVNNGGSPSALFELSQANSYVGSGGCSGCHGVVYETWVGTLHASAYNAITNGSVPTNELVYRTVGYGQPTGFTNSTTTPQLENVGCENCHGPAGWHKNSDHALIIPALTVAAEVCGGCHSTTNRPTYLEWTNSPHAVLPSNFTNGSSAFNNPTAGQAEMMNCGPCHSGAVRLAMLDDYNNRQVGITNYLTLPSGHDAAAYGQTCAVCHDPHSASAYLQSTNVVSTTNVYAWYTNIDGGYGNYTTNIVYATNVLSTTNIVATAYQLRNPMLSTNYFSFFTCIVSNLVYYTNWDGVVTVTTNWMNDNFADQYDPSIHVCAQCHNSRGARWDDIGRIWNGTNIVASAPSWSRGPHNSPQYNILIGIIQPDYLNVNSSGVATNFVSGSNHSGVGDPTSSHFNTNQCATCHVPIYTSGGTNVTGHTFAMQTNNCILCHGSVPNWQSLQTTTSNSINFAVSLLNQWATSNGLALFGANYSNYLQNAWEYTHPGSLATVTNPGPSSADQLLVPNAIKQARFELYMVNNDGSYGVHNPGYVPFLIADATNKVAGQINPAYFAATPASGFVPLTVTFATYGTGITGYSWTFGDGVGTSTSANPTYTYTSPGTNAVVLTVTNASGTVTTTNYIYTYTPPVPAFTANVTTGTHPLIVTFTNLTAATPAVSAWRWTFMGGVSGSPTSTSKNPTFTYTNAGTYSVYLRATATNSPTGGTGNVTTTNLNYIVAQ
jgi:PKD repeat protein